MESCCVNGTQHRASGHTAPPLACVAETNSYASLPYLAVSTKVWTGVLVIPKLYSSILVCSLARDF